MAIATLYACTHQDSSDQARQFTPPASTPSGQPDTTPFQEPGFAPDQEPNSDSEPTSKDIDLTGNCSCGSQSKAILDQELVGKIFPLISETASPSYVEFIKSDQVRAIYQPGPMVEEVLFENELSFPEDLSVSSNEICDVGIYNVEHKQNVRQKVQVCGNDASSCELDPLTQTMIDIEKLQKHIREHQNIQTCNWDQAKTLIWKVYAMSEEGIFAHQDEEKAYGTLTIDLDSQQATFEMDFLSEGAPRMEFANLKNDTALSGASDELNISIGTYSENGQYITHVIGKMSFGDSQYYLVGIPFLKYVKSDIDFNL